MSVVKCPDCHHKVSASDINLNKGVALCRHCDHGFTLESSTEDGPLSVSLKSPATLIKVAKVLNGRLSHLHESETGEVQRPDEKSLGEHRVKVNRDYNGISLELPWSQNGRQWGLLIFAIFWSSISMPIFFNVMLPKLISFEEPAAFIFILHPLVGILMGYGAIASFINKSKLQISNNKLSIKIGPLFWLGNKEIDTRKIQQLYIEKYVAYSRNRYPVRKFQVKVLLEGNVNQVLIKGIKNYQNALAFEVLTEKYLNIEDKAVENDTLAS